MSDMSQAEFEAWAREQRDVFLAVFRRASETTGNRYRVISEPCVIDASGLVTFVTTLRKLDS